MTTTAQATYENGGYAAIHPDWHLSDSGWKASHVLRMLARHGLDPSTVAEVGCGAAGILAALQSSMPGDREFLGYEISPQALRLAAQRTNARLQVRAGGVEAMAGSHFDLLLAMDVVEHVEDYPQFLRALRPLARAKMFHVPLDLSLQGLARGLPSRVRQTAGHLHYFTKPLFVAALEESGYTIQDAFYTLPAVEGSWSSTMSRLAKLPRRLGFAISPDWTALYLGGCSLFVYAE